jgi:diguanylate cyclase (GGDEF)-like protein
MTTARGWDPAWGMAAMTMSSRFSPADEQRHLLVSWVQRCLAGGISPEACITPEARQLLKALREAVQVGGPTNHLGRAARGWGASFSAPTEVLAYLSALRAVLSEPGIGAPGWEGDWLPVAHELLTRVFDQLMREAVDAAAASLREAARTDALTGCANRMALNEDLARAVGAARDSDLDLAVAMVDLDRLKQINDSQGHEAGDVALVSLTATLQRMLRAADSLYRIGGDEFVVLAPFTNAEGADAMLRRAAEIPGPAFSWGVASLGTVGAAAFEQPDLLLSAADTSLYATKARKPAASRRERHQRAATGIWEGTLRRISTATGVVTAAAVLIAVVGALGFALSIEGGSTPKGYYAIQAPPPTIPYLPASRGSTTTPPVGGQGSTHTHQSASGAPHSASGGSLPAAGGSASGAGSTGDDNGTGSSSGATSSAGSGPSAGSPSAQPPSGSGGGTHGSGSGTSHGSSRHHGGGTGNGSGGGGGGVGGGGVGGVGGGGVTALVVAPTIPATSGFVQPAGGQSGGVTAALIPWVTVHVGATRPAAHGHGAKAAPSQVATAAPGHGANAAHGHGAKAAPGNRHLGQHVPAGARSHGSGHRPGHAGTHPRAAFRHHGRPLGHGHGHGHGRAKNHGHGHGHAGRAHRRGRWSR